MISEIFAEHPWLWPLAWQSTLCLAAGLGGSFLLRRHAVRAHQVLLLGLVAAVLIPALSQIVKRNQWGLLVAERAVATPEGQPIPAPADVVIPDQPVPTEAPDLPLPTGVLEAASVPANTRFDWTRAVLPAWLALSSVLLLRLAVRFLLGRRLAKRSEVIEDVRFLHMIEVAKGKLGIQTEVRVRASAQARSPVIWCWGRRPVLLVPTEPRRDEDLDWPSILCHELAHAKRRDHVSGLLAELMVCALPWQPLVWWARQRLAALSEEACDDWVIACGQRATGYARTLLGLTAQGQAAFLPGVVTSRHGLAGRVRRIIEDGCGNPRPGLRWTLAAVAFAGCLSLGIAFAQARPARPKTTTTNQGAPTSLPTAAPASLDAKALLADWKAHYGGIHRMHVRLSEKVIAGGDRKDRPVELEIGDLVGFQIADLTFDKDTKRFHLLYSRREGGLDDPLRAYESAFDGKVTRQYWGDGTRRQGGIAPGSRGNNPRLLVNQFERYLLLLHVGLPPSGLVIVGVPSDSSFKTVALMDYLSDIAKAGGDSIVVKPTLETVAKEPCHVVEVKKGAGGEGQPAMKLWFAQGKGMLPMKFQLLSGADVLKEIVVLDTAKTEADTGVMWYPSKARFTQYILGHDEAGNEVTRELTYEQQVFAFTPNVKVDDSTFQFAFPPGTDVIDEVGGMLGGQPPTQVAAPADKEPPPPAAEGEKILLRLVDPNGRPVPEAHVSPHVQVHELPMLNRRLEWPLARTSDENGQVTIETRALFSPPAKQGETSTSTVYALHEKRGIGAVQEIALADSRNVWTIVLWPICRVHGTVRSTALEAKGMPLRWASLDVGHNGGTPLLQCSFERDNHSFEFSLPPGNYWLESGGTAGKVRNPMSIVALTEFTRRTVTVSEGLRDLDLGVIDLPPTKVSALIGQPAPEIGPVKAWRNGLGVTLAGLKGRLVWLHLGGRDPDVGGDMARLVELCEAHDSRGLTIVAIFSCDSMEELRQRWAAAYQKAGGAQTVPFYVGVDGGATRATYGITRGQDVLIDPAGNVVGVPSTLFTKEAVSRILGEGAKGPLPAWHRQFDEVYFIDSHEVLKRIAPPYIAERLDYYREKYPGSAERIPRGPDRMVLTWNGALKDWGMGYGPANWLSTILTTVLELHSYEYDGPQELLNLWLPGDWIVRREAPREAKLRALEELVAHELARKIRFEQRSVPREAIVVTGRFQFHPIAPLVGTRGEAFVHFYTAAADLDESTGGGGTALSVHQFLEVLGDHVQMPIVDQTEPSVLDEILYSYHTSSSRVSRIRDLQEKAEQLTRLLANVSAQTGLQFVVRQEPVPIWFVTE